jgi:hypothetical protein
MTRDDIIRMAQEAEINGLGDSRQRVRKESERKGDDMTDKILIDRAVVEQALEALETLQGGCTDHDDGTVEALTVWCPEVIAPLKAALEHDAAIDTTEKRVEKTVESEHDRAVKAIRALANAFDGLGKGRKKNREVKQEPVGWWDSKIGFFEEKHFDQLQPLYTTPPRREWVGLTPEEIDSVTPYCHNKFDLAEFKDFASAIEAKLKEKNNG